VSIVYFLTVLNPHTMTAKKAIAIIAGVGPGTGTAVAKRFSSIYNVIVLARNPDSYKDAVEEIEKTGGSALGLSVDVTNEESVKDAFKVMEKKFPGLPLAAGVFNVGGKFVKRPFLEQDPDQMLSNLKANG